MPIILIFAIRKFKSDSATEVQQANKGNRVSIITDVCYN
jgi:hypothetical protein